MASLITSRLFPPAFSPSFSGHETFVLRGTWLKKAFDLLCDDSTLFSRDDAFVRLGVGKNMASSIRFWGRVCGMFERGDEHATVPTTLATRLLADAGWDPFLVSPASAWLLHWLLAARPEAAFTWFYTFNLLRGGEFTLPGLAAQLQTIAREHDWRVPSDTTVGRDIDCMLRCYRRPESGEPTIDEDMLLCPFLQLGLLQRLPGQATYRLISGPQETLPDALVAYAIHAMVERSGRRTIAFSELAYGPMSPGRLFRLDEDSLLARLRTLDELTQGAAYYTDQAGVRQVAWQGPVGSPVDYELLERAFQPEVMQRG